MLTLALLMLPAAAALIASSPPPFSSAPAGCLSNGSWWLEMTEHGPFYKNVKDYGAKGDGVTDDTASITQALTVGRSGTYTTKTPTAIYFPPGTYIVSKSLPIFFYTFVSGSPCAPSIVQTAANINFGGYIFDGDAGEGEWSEDDDQFYRGISHLTIVNGAGNAGATGVHWAQSQAAHLRNVTIDMSAGGKAGFFGENGSGGFIDGLTLIGGVIPMNFGNQQFAVNNLVIVGDASTTACANLFWSWTLTFTRLSLSNCPIGITFLGHAAGALLLIDSSMENVGLGVQTGFTPGGPWANASALYFERLTVSNVPQITEGLPGGAGVTSVASWAQGPTYRKGVLAGDAQSALPLMQPNPIGLPPRPTLADLAPSEVVNVLSFGAKGDGVADDTAAVKAAIAAQPPNGAVFFPQGAYLVSDTITLRADSTIMGEALSELRPSPSAPLWSSAAAPAPLLLLPASAPGATSFPRVIEMLLATTGDGDVPGCVLLDWQSGAGTGLWDVHQRIYDVAHTLTHIHGAGAGGAWSNGWNWLSDHNIDTNAPLTVDNPRGVLVEGIQGPLLLFAVASEHSALYQFNFTASSNIIHVTAQTETAYWQMPQSGWGQTIEASGGNHTIYGAGHYSWFDGPQNAIFRLVDSAALVNIYSLNTYGVNFVEVGDVTVAANQTTDQDWFTNMIIAQINA